MFYTLFSYSVFEDCCVSNAEKTFQTSVVSGHVWFLAAVGDHMQPWRPQFSGSPEGKLKQGKEVLKIRVCKASVLSVRPGYCSPAVQNKELGTSHWS